MCFKFWVVCQAAAAATETRPLKPPPLSTPTTLEPYLLLPPLYSPREPQLQPCRATCTSSMSHGLLRQHFFPRVIISRVFIPTCQSDSHSSFKIWPTCYVIPFKKYSLPSLSLGCISFTSVFCSIMTVFTGKLVQCSSLCLQLGNTIVSRK